MRRRKLIACSSAVLLCASVGALAAGVAVGVGPPTADDVSASGVAGGPIEVTLSASDDSENTLTFSIVDGPAHGSLGPVSPQGCNGVGDGVECTATVIYTSPAGYNGADSFTYKATDTADSNIATASLAVTAVPLIPDDQLLTVGAAYSGTASRVAPGAVVDYGDGAGPQPLTVSGGTAQLAHAYTSEGSFPVTVTNPGPPAQSASSFAHVLLTGPTAGTTTEVPPGGTGTASVPGISATLLTSPFDPNPSSLIVATYAPTNPSFVIAGPQGSVAAGFDLRAVGTTSADTLVVTFSYPDPGDGSVPSLRFFDPGAGSFVPAIGSRRVPNSLAVDSLGRRITIIFDDTSFPPLAALNGTRFAILKPPRISRLSVRRCASAQDGPRKLRLGFTLSQAATVELRVARRKGSAQRSRCPRSERHGRRSNPKFKRPTISAKTLGAGRQTVKLPVRGLRPGSYRVTLSARNAAGNSPELSRRLALLRTQP